MMKHSLKKTLLLGTVTAVAICLSGCDLDQYQQDILYGPVATSSDVMAERPHDPYRGGFMGKYSGQLKCVFVCVVTIGALFLGGCGRKIDKILSKNAAKTIEKSSDVHGFMGYSFGTPRSEIYEKEVTEKKLDDSQVQNDADLVLKDLDTSGLNMSVHYCFDEDDNLSGGEYIFDKSSGSDDLSFDNFEMAAEAYASVYDDIYTPVIDFYTSLYGKPVSSYSDKECKDPSYGAVRSYARWGYDENDITGDYISVYLYCVPTDNTSPVLEEDTEGNTEPNDTAEHYTIGMSVEYDHAIPEEDAMFVYNAYPHSQRLSAFTQPQ